MAGGQEVLGQYFMVSLDINQQNIKRGVPFDIAWSFHGYDIGEAYTAQLYINNKLVFATNGWEDTKTYHYTPITKHLDIEIVINIDTSITINGDVQNTDSVSINIKNGTLSQSMNYVYDSIKNIMDWKEWSYNHHKYDVDNITTITSRIFEYDPYGVFNPDNYSFWENTPQPMTPSLSFSTQDGKMHYSNIMPNPIGLSFNNISSDFESFCLKAEWLDMPLIEDYYNVIIKLRAGPINNVQTFETSMIVSSADDITFNFMLYKENNRLVLDLIETGDRYSISLNNNSEKLTIGFSFELSDAPMVGQTIYISYPTNNEYGFEGFWKERELPIVTKPNPATIASNVYYIARLLKTYLNACNISAETSEGITTLIDKLHLLKWGESVDVKSMDESIFNGTIESTVGGSGGTPSYSFEDSMIKRTVNGWSAISHMLVYPWESGSKAFNVTFSKADGIERNGLVLYTLRNHDFYKLYLTRQPESIDVTNRIVITKNYMDCSGDGQFDTDVLIDSQEITLPNEYTLSIYIVQTRFIYFIAYDNTNSELMYEYKMDISALEDYDFDYYCLGLNLGYYGSSDGAGYINYIKNIELNSLEPYEITQA